MNLDEIFDDFSQSQGDNDWLWRNRPYKGQAHTDSGERGKTEVKDITFRDLRDCFILACFDAANDQLTEEQNERRGKDRMTLNEIYKLDLNKLDPIAWAQNMSVRIEKMMGIFPNIPPLGPLMQKNSPGDKCPKCGAPEVEANTPSTVYACGASDYDHRPGTFNPCKIDPPPSPTPRPGEVCGGCGGKKYIYVQANQGPGSGLSVRTLCPRCKGSGLEGE